MESGKKATVHYSSVQMTRKRELGQIFKEDTLSSTYYKHIRRKSSWTMDDMGTTDHGSVFNVEFSPNGKILVAACEKATILIFDPLPRKLISKIQPAHEDCVNCICFLDERTFASGSDDYHIALWDARMLREQVKKLEGHTSWVKSLAYHKQTTKLVSSAFDGTVRAWDINRYSESNAVSKVLVEIKQLTRMQLSPGGDKLIISTLGGSLTIFHNLDIESFQEDTSKREFANHLVSHQNFQKSFSLSRNHPESIIEFPQPPWCISSLKVHPCGWCLMSRYTSTRPHLEYTTIHDIQSIPQDQSRQGRTMNVKRLSHYIEESNAGEGFIKEQGFSKDGRIIASPFGHGIRLLAFGAGCCELSKCDQDSPVTCELHEIKYLLSHQHPVCTSKFSPTHMLFASGCLGGKIAFHEPKFS